MQICWDKKIEGRPPIQEVVEGVGNASTKWHTDMQPSPPEQREESVLEESDEFKHREFSLLPTSHHVYLPLLFR